jgi:molybdate transport system substrate-binding protein
MRCALFLLLSFALFGTSCSTGNAKEKPLRVFAASSLSSAFKALTSAYERHYPESLIELHVAGTPQLVMQVEEGVQVDVFASANKFHMVRAQMFGEPQEPFWVFATNELAIAVAEGNPQSVAGIADLFRKDLLVALCGPAVPAGRYARAALKKAKEPVTSISDEPSVRALVSKIELGELDAGIVYVTDIRDAKVDSVAIASEHQVLVEYPIIALRPAGKSFVAFALSEEGQAIMASHGFGPK